MLTSSEVVLTHDWITGFRGGERVLDAICEIFPKSSLYTLIYKTGSSSQRIEDRSIHTSWLNHIPGIDRHYPKLLPLMPLAAQSLQIPDDTKLVLSSSHCVIKGVPKPKSAIHISYVHSPMRYMYDQYENYFGAQAPLYQRWGARVFKTYLTEWDLESNSQVDHMIANSEFVRQRIKTYYGRDATVIHPFVDLKDFENLSSEKEDFYLMVTAFAPNKKVDLAIQAFNKSKKKLKIIGTGQQELYLKSIANENIDFLGALSRKEVVKLMAQAKAFIFPGVEDFGITPLESMAAGTPVIAYAIGGALETVTPATGYFFHEPTAESLASAVEDFSRKDYTAEDLKQRAAQFSREAFIQKLSSFIESKTSN